jgi:hypothetical protein
MNLLTRNRKIILLIALVAVASASLVLAWYITDRMRPLPVTLPSENEIERMTAEVFGEEIGQPSIPTFVIPPKHYALILSAMTPTERRSFPGYPEDMTVGHLEIITKDGRRLTVRFYEDGQNPLCFSVDGIRCGRGGEYKPIYAGSDVGYIDESIWLFTILLKIHLKEFADLTQMGQDLERSKGQRPPR